MESLDELSKINNGKPGFFKHVFNFNQNSKDEMLNVVQYAILAIIPIVILNKLMQRFVPEADDEKSSIEITAEILAQIITMFLVIVIINKIITYVPTYSGEKYPEFNVTNIVLSILIITLSLQTKLGEKVSILVDRLIELWEGRGQTNNKNSKNGKGNGQVKVSQPISQNQTAMNQSLNSMGSTSISSLPPIQSTMSQQLPNYDQMHQQDSTPLIGAASPVSENFEPAPANMGGGAFGSTFGGGW